MCGPVGQEILPDGCVSLLNIGEFFICVIILGRKSFLMVVFFFCALYHSRACLIDNDQDLNSMHASAGSMLQGCRRLFCVTCGFSLQSWVYDRISESRAHMYVGFV